MKIIRRFQEMRINYIVWCIERKVEKTALDRQHNRGGDRFFRKMIEEFEAETKSWNFDKLRWNMA